MIGKPIFDWSINLGHVLTFLGFVLTGSIAFQNLDKRVVVLEHASAYQTTRDAAQDLAQKEIKLDLKDALRDLTNSVEKLGEKLDRRK